MTNEPKDILIYLLSFYDNFLAPQLIENFVTWKNKNHEHQLLKLLHPHIITFQTRYLNTTKVLDYRNNSSSLHKSLPHYLFACHRLYQHNIKQIHIFHGTNREML